MTTAVGIMHPGAMGISIAATMKNSGYDVYWASEGRSQQSRTRAEEHVLLDAGTIAELCNRSEMIISVCPPHAAEEVADSIIENGFQRMFIDGNAISPQRAQRIGEKVSSAGITFVDGSIIGGPAWKPNATWLHLSGAEAEPAEVYFAAGPLETSVVGSDIGQASALKMCFAAYTKGMSAVLGMILAGAEALGVRPQLETQWTQYWPDFCGRNPIPGAACVG